MQEEAIWHGGEDRDTYRNVKLARWFVDGPEDHKNASKTMEASERQVFCKLLILAGENLVLNGIFGF